MQVFMSQFSFPFYEDVIKPNENLWDFWNIAQSNSEEWGMNCGAAASKKRTVRNKSENHFNAAYGHDVYVMIIVRDCL